MKQLTLFYDKRPIQHLIIWSRGNQWLGWDDYVTIHKSRRKALDFLKILSLKGKRIFDLHYQAL